MIYPSYLKKGDTIGVTAVSDGNADEIRKIRIESAKKNFEQRGYKICETPNVRTSFRGRSASKEERAEQFMSLIENQSINGIISARGGDFLLEILPYIDFEKIKKKPKWVHGFSDTTGLSFCITTICDISTSYGENFGEFGMVPWHSSLENALKILEGSHILQTSFEEYQDNFYDRVTGIEGYKFDTRVEWKNAKNEQEIVLEGRTLGRMLRYFDIISRNKI